MDASAGGNQGGAAGGPVDQTLVAYLAQRDTPCPHCGYNLRGVESPRCPECGGALELTLARPRRLSGWGPFLLLVFGWLLLAGGMNTARSVSTLIQERDRLAQAGNSVQRTRAALQAQISRLQKQPASLGDPFPTLLDDRFPGMESMREFQAQAARDMNAMMVRQLQAQLASLPAPAPAATPTMVDVWASSGWSVRVGSIWAVSLAGLSLAGLIALAAAWWRGSPRAGPLAAGACLLFAVYGTWHVVLFVLEMR